MVRGRKLELIQVREIIYQNACIVNGIFEVAKWYGLHRLFQTVIL